MFSVVSWCWNMNILYFIGIFLVWKWNQVLQDSTWNIWDVLLLRMGTYTYDTYGIPGPNEIWNRHRYVFACSSFNFTRTLRNTCVHQKPLCPGGTSHTHSSFYSCADQHPVLREAVQLNKPGLTLRKPMKLASVRVQYTSDRQYSVAADTEAEQEDRRSQVYRTGAQNVWVLEDLLNWLL